MVDQYEVMFHPKGNKKNNVFNVLYIGVDSLPKLANRHIEPQVDVVIDCNITPSPLGSTKNTAPF